MDLNFFSGNDGVFSVFKFFLPRSSIFFDSSFVLHSYSGQTNRAINYVALRLDPGPPREGRGQRCPGTRHVFLGGLKLFKVKFASF